MLGPAKPRCPEVKSNFAEVAAAMRKVQAAEAAATAAKEKLPAAAAPGEVREPAGSGLAEALDMDEHLHQELVALRRWTGAVSMDTAGYRKARRNVHSCGYASRDAVTRWLLLFVVGLGAVSMPP